MADLKNKETQRQKRKNCAYDFENARYNKNDMTDLDEILNGSS